MTLQWSGDVKPHRDSGIISSGQLGTDKFSIALAQRRKRSYARWQWALWGRTLIAIHVSEDEWMRALGPWFLEWVANGGGGADDPAVGDIKLVATNQLQYDHRRSEVWYTSHGVGIWSAMKSILRGWNLEDWARPRLLRWIWYTCLYSIFFAYKFPFLPSRAKTTRSERSLIIRVEQPFNRFDIYGVFSKRCRKLQEIIPWTT